MTQEIRTRLLLMADAQYGSFSKSLIPECKPLLGVRLPALRKMAQEFVKNKEQMQTAAEKDLECQDKQTAQTMFILKKPCCAVC